VDADALKAKIADGKAVPGDFPTEFTKADFSRKLHDQLIKPLDAKIDELKTHVDQLDQKVISQQHAVDVQENDLRQRVDDDIRKNVSYYRLGLSGFAAMTIVLIATLGLFFVARNPHSAGLVHEFLESRQLLDLSTVFILALAIIMLGLNEKLSSEVLGTLLGGISGYVLGRATRAAERAEIKKLLERKESGDSGSSQNSP
jgi:hypothetical protein